MFGITKTTVIGIGTVLGGIGLIGNMLKTGGYDVNTITLAIGQIGAGLGLIFAKDAKPPAAP